MIDLDEMYKQGLFKTIQDSNNKIDLPGGNSDDQPASEEKFNSDYEKAKNHAFNYLAYRARTCREMRTYLNKKGYPAEITEKVINVLKHLEMLDDEAFADQFIREHMNGKPVGRKAIIYRLRQLGVESSVINAKLADYYSDNTEYELAWQAVTDYCARKKITIDDDPLTFKKNTIAFQRRLTAFLQRRGFSYEVIKEIIYSPRLKVFLTETK